MKRLLYNKLFGLYKTLGRRVSVGLLGLGTTNSAVLDILLDLYDIVSVTIRQKGLDPVGFCEKISVKATDQAFLGICEDVIIPSPSVRRERLSIPKDTLVITDLDLLLEQRPENLFTVSGSDGKSTTVTLASLLLYPTFPDIFTGGNLGTPIWTANAESEAFLLELSSFNLRYTKPRGGRALLTNVTPNHLDWHSSLEEYESTKLGMIYSASEPILNLDDPISKKSAHGINSFCLISLAMTDNEIRSRYKTEHTLTLTDGVIRLDGEYIIASAEVRRNERHNLLNLCSAIALSIGYADIEHIREVARSFEGLSERCEAFTKGGVEYVSSSIDTTPERTKTTLEGLGKRVRLILGGRGKGLSLKPLREVLIKYAQRIAIYGEIRDDINRFIESDCELRRIPHESFELFDPAVDYAALGAKEGDTVLLSPAATGYGEFRDYKERGIHFKDYIKNGCK
jgi:UDP-N-acetylmuramoylalanine--D-glutamate ligase